MSHPGLLNHVIQQEGAQAYAWLQSVWEGRQKVPEDFNWLGLAKGAAFNATSQCVLTSSPPDLDWAKVAVEVYEYLIGKADPSRRNSLEYSLMHLRAFCIVRLGVVAHDPLLDVDQLVQWFFRDLKLGPEQAAQKAASWRDLPIDEIRALRQIKNKLSAMKGLYENNMLPPNQELPLWLSLREKLP